MRVRFLLAAVALPLSLSAAWPFSSAGQPSKQETLGKLEQRIDRTRDKIGRKRGTERVLSTEVAGYTQRIDRLQGRISSLAERQQRIQTDLDTKLRELERVRSLLRRERARLVRLRKRLGACRRSRRRVGGERA